MLFANIKSQENYNGAALDKLNRSLTLLEITINSSKFKNAVLHFTSFQFTMYKCLGGIKLKTIQPEQFTNDKLYEILIKGHRQLGNNTFMDLKLRLSDKNGGSAVGETDANDVTTTFRNAFVSMNDAELAAHLAHEWTHTLGFRHSFSDGCDKTRNCLSVPYAIGNLIETILTGKNWYGCKYESITQ